MVSIASSFLLMCFVAFDVGLAAAVEPGFTSIQVGDESATDGSQSSWAELTRWMRDHGASVHGSLRASWVLRGGAKIRGVVSDSSINAGTLLMIVPKTLWISSDTSAQLADATLPDNCSLGNPSHMKLAVTLALLEKGIGDTSWLPYMRMQPTRADFSAFFPSAAGPSVFADFGSLPVLHDLSLGAPFNDPVTKSCFEMWRSMPASPVARLAWDEVSLNLLRVQTRAYSCEQGIACVVPGADLFNTDINARVNAEWDFTNGAFYLRASHDVGIGDEILLEYVPECDNEGLLSVWGVYLEASPFRLDKEAVVDCSYAWSADGNANATVGSVREAAMAMLDVDASPKALQAGWTAPRCDNTAVASTPHGPARCETWAATLWKHRRAFKPQLDSIRSTLERASS